MTAPAPAHPFTRSHERVDDEAYQRAVENVIGHVKSELGMENKRFKQNVRALAYKSPSTYMNLKNLYEIFLENLVVDLHTKIFKFLTTGSYNGRAIVEDLVNERGDAVENIRPYSPQYSPAEAKSMALGVASSVYKIMEEQFLNDVFPESLIEEALARARQVR